MCLLHCRHNRAQLLLAGLVHRVLMIHTNHWLVRRYRYNVHSVDLTKFLFLCQCRTSHSGFLLIFIKEVLERDRRQSLALSLYLYALLRLNRLMKSV